MKLHLKMVEQRGLIIICLQTWISQIMIYGKIVRIHIIKAAILLKKLIKELILLGLQNFSIIKIISLILRKSQMYFWLFLFLKNNEIYKKRYNAIQNSSSNF